MQGEDSSETQALTLTPRLYLREGATIMFSFVSVFASLLSSLLRFVSFFVSFRSMVGLVPSLWTLPAVKMVHPHLIVTSLRYASPKQRLRHSRR